jgi:hypothetical protein
LRCGGGKHSGIGSGIDISPLASVEPLQPSIVPQKAAPPWQLLQRLLPGVLLPRYTPTPTPDGSD